MIRVAGNLHISRILSSMVEQIKKRTRNFAKRQMTWFKKMRNITWIDVGDDKEAVVDIIINIITIDENK